MAATTITRATITDDSGSGTDGTVLNSAWFGTAIYDKVDALFTSSGPTYESSQASGLEFKVYNTANSASAFGRVNISVGGTSALDPYLVLGVAGGENWSLGIDNSDSDKFVIAHAVGLGTDNAIAIDTGEYCYFSKPLILTEVTANPTDAQLAADAALAIYTKADKLVFAYNNGGTITYITLDLDGSDTSLTHGTSAP